MRNVEMGKNVATKELSSYERKKIKITLQMDSFMVSL